jgi:hypothetical protein
MKRSALIFPALAIAVAVGCVSSSSSATSASVEARKTTTTVKKKKVVTTTLAPKGSTVTNTALAVLTTITVQNERPSGYSRSLFKHWVDADGDSCDTREEVLIAESTSRAQVDAYGCKVIEGDWLSPYDNVTHTNPSELDIDHMIPLKEAWDSGAWAWSVMKRQLFANDLTDARSLIAVTAGQNRSKSDRDPSNWLPPQTQYRCTYLAEWVAIKSHWKLSMDQSEFGRIKNVLTASCGSTTVAAWGTAGSAKGAVQGGSSVTTPASPPSTARPSNSASATTPAPGGGVRKVSPVRCAKADFGQTGEYRGIPYICSDRKQDGTLYKPNYFFWRPA